MKKRFNTTGTCVKDLHYMMDVDKKINKVKKMIEYGDYFIINRPRQFGKTTFLSVLGHELENEYTVISISFEGVGDESFSSEEKFCSMFIREVMSSFRFTNVHEYKKIKEMANRINLCSMIDLSDFITEYVEDNEKEVLLIIDEVDKISHNLLFLSFLGILRTKYLKAREKKDLTFKSVILAGVHDIKNLKIGIRDNEEKRYNSPWNIAVNFNVDMAFNIDEIESMIIEYKDDNNVNIDTKEISRKIYYYTNGYAFLISRLCQIVDEEIYADTDRIDTVWNEVTLRKAVKILLKENNTLFDDLIKNLENNLELSSFIYEIVFNGAVKQFNYDNPIINLAYVYGIIKDDNGIVKVSSRIFEQRIYNYYTSKTETISKNLSDYNFKENFIMDDGGLNMERVLIKFQQFMKEQYSAKDKGFLEYNGRTLFLAFIKPIINGVGFDFKEVQISEEKRLDIVIIYNNFKYIVELKVWRGDSYHKKGLSQLNDYLDINNLEKGYLLVFNFNKNKEYKEERTLIDGKEIFTVYV